MKTTLHAPDLDSLDALTDVEAVCVFVTEDERPLPGLAGYIDWRLCGALSRVLLNEFFVGAAGDHLLVPTLGRMAIPRLFVVGVGPSAQVRHDGLVEVVRGAARMLNRAGMKSVALEVPGSGQLDVGARASLVNDVFAPEFRGDRLAIVSEKDLRTGLGGQVEQRA